MLTLGTAGHIDHGKSSIIRALTDIDPDRLPEEKARGMTIDLGFAWLKLPSGETVGIVDVPGHQQFINHVAPGLFGIDAALLVVAVDDGWMPQTEEHLQILDLLGIQNGIVVLNKVDMMPDAEWLDLVEKDITQHLENTALAGSPIIRVSARTGQGIDRLTETIIALASRLKPRQDIGKPRLAVDRVFTMKGSGVVVTGTLNQGIFHSGDEIAVWPQGGKGHIRTIESYKQVTGQAEPGSRVALNLSGYKREELKRGDIVLAAAQDAPLSTLIDIDLRLLEGLPLPLKNMTEVLVYMETRELLARVVLLEGRTLNPGQHALAQLRFTEPVTSFIGERFIIRRQSPAATIGGGVVLNPQGARYRLAKMEVRAWLERRRSLELDDLLTSELQRLGYMEGKGLLSASLFDAAEITTAVKRLLDSGKLIDAAGYLIDPEVWESWQTRLLDTVTRELSAEKLKKGVAPAIPQSALGLPKELFDALVVNLISKGKLAREEGSLALPEHKPHLSDQQAEMSKAVLALFKKASSTPPGMKEIVAALPGSAPVVRYLLQQKQLLELPDGILLESEQFTEIQQFVVTLLIQKGQVTIQEIAARFGFSRKYSIPLMNYLDRLGITRREGDMRVAGRKTASQ